MTHHHAHKRATPPPFWTERLRNALPTREVLTAHPWLKPIANRVLEPKLWRLQHEAVARGVAIGTFWAFAIPVGPGTGDCVYRALRVVARPYSGGRRGDPGHQPPDHRFLAVAGLPVGQPDLGRARRSSCPACKAAVPWLGWPPMALPPCWAWVCLPLRARQLGYGAVKLGWRLRIWLKRRNRGPRAESNKA